MQRSFNLLFALVAYAIFFATFLYLIAFVGNLPVAPITVDRGPSAPIEIALVINIGLIALFGLQHSTMARQGFKKWWTRVVPWSAERSVYVLMASAMLIVLMTLWRPIDGTVWSVTGETARVIIWSLFAIGWFVVLLSTFLINHFELFGLQQAWLHFRGRQGAAPEFRQPLLYRWVRHPLYLGFFIAFWAIPDMSYGHLLLSIGLSIYMLTAIRFEERDLVALFGDRYVRYRVEVGMLVPRFGRREGMPPAE